MSKNKNPTILLVGFLLELIIDYTISIQISALQQENQPLQQENQLSQQENQP